MATTKVTFTLDPVSKDRLARTAERLNRSKSEVVREAILDYSERLGRLSERERVSMLARFDELVGKIPAREDVATDSEIEAVRQARRSGGRGHAQGAPARDR